MIDARDRHDEFACKPRLEGKRVLITGTAGEIGGAAQTLFAEEGARVIGCDLRPGTAEDAAERLREEGHEVYGDTVDLCDADAAEAWIDSAAERLGGIDVLYNNAAGDGFAPFAEMTRELWRHVMRVELDIVFNTTRPAWRHLLDGGGSIINTASLAALRGLAPVGEVAHAAAKGAVIAMTKALAAEGAPDGIRVNAVSPGLVISRSSDAALTDSIRDFVVSNKLIRRTGAGQDIAFAALYLASDESSWVTGQNFSIDGGATAGFR
jgi:meso-butanediol dehydrogenase / (S,S)-butanediol dehydrogenase / diacetyl reductase